MFGIIDMHIVNELTVTFALLTLSSLYIHHNEGTTPEHFLAKVSHISLILSKYRTIITFRAWSQEC